MSEPGTCPNCGVVISCGCQIITASDGTICCDSCLPSHEARLIDTRVNIP